MNPMSRMRRILLPAFVVLLATAAVACGSDDSSSGPDGTGSAGTEVGVTTTTEGSTVAETTTTTEPPGPTAGAETASQAALALHGAWVADDREAAAGIAEPEAIEGFWAATPGEFVLYSGCDDGEFDTGGCMFRNWSNNHTIQVSLERRDIGWVVTSAFFSEE